MSRDSETLHQQETDFEIVKLIIPFIKSLTFIDIGAEKGTFTDLFTSHNLTGIFFEPLPKHEAILKELARKTNSIFSPYAIDNKDGQANFHIACDDNGDPLDFFHSLQPLTDDNRVQHKKSIPVTCRSLDSLYYEGLITNNIGIIKTDTEGNDLHVLQGMGEISAEALICEYFMPGIYNGWEQGNPYELIAEAKKIGFDNFIAIKRVNIFETLAINPGTFQEKEWGNLIFVKPHIYKAIKSSIDNLISLRQSELVIKFLNHTAELGLEISTLREACAERIELIQSLQNTCEDRLNLINRLNISLLKKTINTKLSPEGNNYTSNEELDAWQAERAILLNRLAHQEGINHALEKSYTSNNMNFLNDINTHFSEIYTRFTEIHQKIIETSTNEIDKLHQKYINLQKEIKTLHPRRSLLGKLATRINSALSPKLGKLNHYPSRPLIIPDHYKNFEGGNNLPTISIVTPSFNHGNFLERTIKSILEQDYPKLEYIVQDGRSDDATLSIIKRYESSLKHFESVKDNGQSHAINLGFRHATGEIMAYVNSDDILLPGALNYIGNYFAKNPNVDVIYSHRILIDEDDQEIGRWILPKHDSKILSWADYIPQETLFWRRSIWEKIGGQIDEEYRFAMDWDLILRFREAEAKFVRVPRFLGAFRIHPHQKTSSQISLIGTEEMYRLRERCHGRDVSFPEIKKAIRFYLYKHLIYHKLYRVGLLQY